MIDGENRKRKNGSKKTIVAWRWNLCVAKKNSKLIIGKETMEQYMKKLIKYEKKMLEK